MAYYLSEFTGDGSELDPFRPPVDGSWGIIDLRGDSTAQTGRCLLWHPDGSLSDSRLDKVADSTVESIPRNIARRIENALGVSLNQFDTLQAIIAELLILHGSFTDPGRWNPLRANRFGRHVIHLGGKVYDAPAPVGATITDDFNRANASPVSDSAEGWSWTELRSTPLGWWSIITNEVFFDSGSSVNAVLRADFDLDTDNHYAQADVEWAVSGSVSAGVAVRANTATPPADADLDAYLGGAIGHSEQEKDEIHKIVNQTRTLLTSQSHTIPVGTMITVRLEVDGSALDLDVDGSTLSTTDTSITGFTRTGLYAQGSEAGRDYWFDNFEAGDLAVFDPANLQASVLDDDVTLTWDASP